MPKNSPVLYKMARAVIIPPFRLVMRPEIRGTENIPSEGGAVLAGNHNRAYDFMMLSGSTGRCLHYLAKIELFRGPLGAFLKGAGIIPVDRSKRNHGAMNSAREYLNDGCLVAVFPEGRVNKTDEVLLPFRMGAVKMAKDTGAPIIPFTITGEYKLYGPRPEIRFYPPYCVGDDELTAENEKFRKFIYDNLIK